MPRGAVVLQLTDLAGEPLRSKVEIDLKPVDGDTGAGGTHMGVGVNMGKSTDLHITGIECRGGVATSYGVLVQAPHRKPYRFFQPIREDRVNPASDDVELWIEPNEVKNITAPVFDDLKPRLRKILNSASMVASSGLAGLQGAALYKKLTPMQKACLLNIACKAAHKGTTENCLESVGALLDSRQDRIFALVDKRLPAEVLASPAFRSENPALHTPLDGFRLTGVSVKSKDNHANLQLTFMENPETGEVAADIDIDESTGILHGFEVIQNTLTGGKTNPYLIHEFLLAADPRERTLDPGYGFVFA